MSGGNHAEMNLRDHLLAVTNNGQTTADATPYPPMTPTNPSTHDGYHQPPDTARQHEAMEAHDGMAAQQVIAPYAHMGGEAMHEVGHEGAESPSSAKGKRPLSTSKRAAQNREAQRAFRQRKECYIKKLEQQLRDYQSADNAYRTIQEENYQLRDYIVKLQTRLLENRCDVPPPPPQLDLSGSAPIVTMAQRQADGTTSPYPLVAPEYSNPRAHHPHHHQTEEDVTSGSKIK
ncbi:hypothetical protein K470DRAFT_275074 [Piedraia hortae CBS 480.64]|uniref:Putative transcription factor kapC n=1 Tax=Piedraia hortae CBS 480.64 TaxID=1314780 RepID=A0A6A7C644_9PEZI|nr:hypothetical protein K470DRAFT_275074 [Piedraia hortae CBS 480.64]